MDHCLSFCLFHLAVMLSVLRFAASDYPFGIFKLFIFLLESTKTCTQFSEMFLELFFVCIVSYSKYFCVEQTCEYDSLFFPECVSVTIRWRTTFKAIWLNLKLDVYWTFLAIHSHLTASYIKLCQVISNSILYKVMSGNL